MSPRLVLTALGALPLCFALFACTTDPVEEAGGESEASSETDSASSDTDTASSETETDTAGPPLDNGPSGPTVVVNSCAPDDGSAWEFTIGPTSGCDSAMPDPAEPFVRITVYDLALLSDPVGTTTVWTDWQPAQGQYAPEGAEGMLRNASAGSIHIESWDMVGEEGSEISGWYTLTLDDDQGEIGGSFTGRYCGGDVLCG